MADKGKMIELRIDTSRITSLAPLYQETPIVGGERRAFIAAPQEEPFAAVAGQLAADLESLCSASFECVNEAAFGSAETLADTVIAVGHGGNNRLLRRLHYLGFLHLKDYAREGLCLKTIHNPFGDGRNVVAALGAAPDVTARGTRALLDHIEQRDGVFLVPGRLHVVSPEPDAGDVDACIANAGERCRPGHTGWPIGFQNALAKLAETGSEAWARAFFDLVRPYAVGEAPLSFWLMSAIDFWTDSLAKQWDQVEEFPWFTDEERLLITNFVASCTEYCWDAITYQKWRIEKEHLQIFNHHTFPARGLFFGSMYLSRQGYDLPEIDRWLRKSLEVFARAATAGRSFDEGSAGYSWLVGNHLLEVGFACNDFSYARSDKMTHYADLATLVLNNRFDPVPFGDCGAYHVSHNDHWGGLLPTLLLEAAQWRDAPEYKWVAQKIAPQAVANNVFTADLPAVPPKHHTGLFVLPMDPVIHRWTGLPRFPNYPPPAVQPGVPPEKGFDKLTFRAGWDADDDYLLLQGFGEGQHGHPDANAISQYQAYGRIFLADSDYIRRMPKNHNMMMVIKDGAHGPIPVTARLDTAVEFSCGALTQSTLPDYNGCDWMRTLLWLKNDCVVCVDTLRAREDAEYELRCYFRTLGEAEMTEAGMHAVHDGKHFHVIELTASNQTMEIEEPPIHQEKYPEYEFGSAVPKVLCEKRRLPLEAGEAVCFVNLLLPNGDSGAPRRSLRYTTDGQVLVEGDGPAIWLSEGGMRVAECGSYAFAPHLRLDGLGAFAAAPVAPACSPAAQGPASHDVQTVVLQAPVTALGMGEDGDVLAGCADGAVVRVQPDGTFNELAKTTEKVTALHCARLWGETQPTCFFTGYDSQVHFLEYDGSQRAAVALPENYNMPGWGKALAVADLHGDGRLWPIAGTAAWRVHAFGPEMSILWSFDSASHVITDLAAGDLNGDGCDEIVAATVYFCVPAIAADGSRLWQDEDYNDYWTAGPHFRQVFIHDVDRDGVPEVITAGSDTLIHCISHTGEKKWTASIGDDPAGLVVGEMGIAAAAMSGDVHLYDGSGRRLWRHYLGAPCTAMSGDGKALWAGTEDGGLHCLDTTSGMLRARYCFDAPINRLLLAAGGIVVAATADKRLHFVQG